MKGKVTHTPFEVAADVCDFKESWSLATCWLSVGELPGSFLTVMCTTVTCCGGLAVSRGAVLLMAGAPLEQKSGLPTVQRPSITLKVGVV
jgi:hypothetical protein